MIRFAGCDISLNHGAIVTLDWDGALDFRCFTDVAGEAARDPVNVTRFPKRKKDEDRHAFALARLDRVDDWVLDASIALMLDKEPMQSYIGLEDYAYDKAQQAHQLGEVGGVVRSFFWYHRMHMRIHDVGSIKMYATGRGNATKEEVIEAALTQFPSATFAAFIRHDGTQLLADLCDAYTIATMVRTELHLRLGATTHATLPERCLRVFNRVTKANPTNVLARDWVHRAPQP